MLSMHDHRKEIHIVEWRHSKDRESKDKTCQTKEW